MCIRDRIKAIDKFDTGFDVKFSTYAVPMITGEIKRFLRDDGMIKVSRSIKELGLKVKCAREEMMLFYDTLFGRRVLPSFGGQLLKALQPVLIGAVLAYLPWLPVLLLPSSHCCPM